MGWGQERFFPQLQRSAGALSARDPLDQEILESAEVFPVRGDIEKRLKAKG